MSTQGAGNDFYSIAKALGHDEAALKGGQEVQSTIQVKSAAELRAILSRAGDEERGLRGGLFFDTIAHRQRLLQGRHDRVHAHVFADRELTADDDESLGKILPMEVTAVSQVDKTLAPNEVWDLGTSTSPVVVNLGTLTMEAGSRIVIRNTILSLTVQTLVKNGSGGSVPYDIGILGVKPAAPSTAGQGTTGGTGQPGSEGTCKCSNTEPGSNGGKGGGGGTGGGGLPGTRGTDGLPSLKAEITITGSLEGTNGTLAIQTVGGDGGDGGKAGKGGTGGTGGKGGDGKRCTGTCTSGGDGGPGGQGGNGGTGGIGGNGANAEDIFVTVPPAAAARIFGLKVASNPGEGGPGGDSGDGGAGGAGGSGVSHNICGGGNSGGKGLPGSVGSKGDRGAKGGLAGRIIINGKG